MSSPGKILCLMAFLSAFCLMTEAKAKFPGLAGVRAPPQRQTMNNNPQAPMAQTDMGSPSSESGSSEADDDDAAAANAAAPAAAAPAPVGGILGGIPPVVMSNGRQLPNTGARDPNQMFGRGSGSSGKSVGIAFTILALIAVVVVGAYFAVRKYRPRLAGFGEEE